MSNRIRFNKIKKQLIIVFVCAVSLVMSVVYLLNYKLDRYIGRNASLSSIINIAGRQRMISQRMAKSSIISLTDSTLAAQHQKELDSLITVFEQSHIFLREESSKLQRQNDTLNGLLIAIEPYLHGLIKISKEVVSQRTPLPMNSKSEILYHESRFLPLTNQITREFEQESVHVLQSINRNVSYANYAIAFAIFLSAGVVLLISIRVLKQYSKELDQLSDELRNALAREQHKVDRLEFLIETIDIGIWENNRLEGEERWSRQLYEILEYDADEVEATATQFMKSVHPADLQKLIDASESSIATGLPSTVELRVKTRSGSYKWVEATGNVRKDSQNRVELLMGAVIDITDRKILEMQLKAFIERAPAAIAMFNRNMEYIAASHQWIEDYQLQQKIIIGKSHYVIFPEIDEQWKSIHQNCLNGAVEVNEEDPFERIDGTIQYVKWEVRPWYLSENEVGGVLMFTEDVSQSKFEKEELKTAKDEAEKASKAKEDFLATMSHEIRTPLNAINGISHILLMENPRPEQVEHLNLLRFSGENLLNLINDILDMSKIESGKLELSIAPFDLYYLIQNIKNSMSFRARENLVTIDVAYDENLPRGFEGDSARLTQIMYNLVGNAIKFTEGGSVSIKVKLLASNDPGYKLRISVEDTGIGIAKENQEKIFRSFEQAESGTTRNYGGTGLGLYITKRLLEIMDSQIQVSSILGEGSAFYFDLDLVKVKNFVASPSNTSLDSFNLKDQHIHILVVEDNTANQTIMKKFLYQAGIGCDLAENGQVALDKIKSKEYDLVLMDLQMPVMDGYTATRKIRGLVGDYFQNIPIVALTADAFHDIKERTLAIGMSDYLSKPFKPVNLYELIARNAGQVTKNPVGFKIESIIDKEAEGDAEFKAVFSKQCLDNYEEFFFKFNLVLETKDLDLFKTIVHKIKALNDLFELNDFHNNLVALGPEREALDFNHDLSKKVHQQSKLIIEELTKICEK